MTPPRKTPAADLAILAVSVLMAAAGAWIVFAGPTRDLPVHWNLQGEVDRWGGREIVGGLIAGLGFLTLALGVGMGMAAARAGDPARARALRMAQVVILLTLPMTALFVGVACLSGADSIGGALPMAGISLLFVVIGAFLGRVGANPFVGVRTPWAFKSRLAWERSNRLAGRLLFLLGLGGLATAPIAPQPLGLQALIAGVVVAAVWSVFESWRVWRADPDRQPF